MARGIKSLLNKKNWTGKDVGKALLMNLKNDIENKGNPNKKPLFSQEDFNRMLDSLDSDTQYTQYKVLETIYSSIVDSFNFNEAMGQQFYNGYYRYFLAIQEAQRAEDFFSTMERFPLILTKKEYDRLTAESLERKRSNTESYYSLFFLTVERFFFEYENDWMDQIPADIMDALTETKSQKVTNKRILANWADDMGAGYYTLPDGRRSDELGGKAWTAALKDNYMKAHRLYIDGELQDEESTVRYYNQKRILAGWKLLYGGMDAIRAAYKEKTGSDISDEDLPKLEEALEDILDENDYPSKRFKTKAELVADEVFEAEDSITEWHYYTNVPSSFMKYEALGDMLDRYRGGYSDRLLEAGGEYVDEIPQREQFKEFKEDYPALYEAIAAYLEGNVPAAKGLKANQLYKDLITWGELADLDYLDFKTRITVRDKDRLETLSQTKEDNTANYNKQTRLAYHGIAVLDHASYLDSGTDGEYIDPVTDELNTEILQGIDRLENNPEEADYIAANLEYLITPALSWMYAYNAFIEVVSAAYNIEFMTAAKYDLTKFEPQIEAFNNLLYMLYKDVYGTKEDKRRKREFIRSYFSPIEVEKLQPTEKAVDALREKIEGLGYTREAANTLRNYRSLINEIRRKGEADE